MNLEQFRHLACEAGADSVMETFAVAQFSGRGLVLSVEVDLGSALPLDVACALEDAARKTGKVGKRVEP